MPRKKGEDKRTLSVRIPTRLDAAIEQKRAAWERAMRKVAGPSMPPPSVPDWIAHIVEKESKR